MFYLLQTHWLHSVLEPSVLAYQWNRILVPPKLHIQTHDPETADQLLEEQPFHDQSVIYTKCQSRVQAQIRNMCSWVPEKLSYMDSVPQRGIEQLKV